MTPRSDGSVSGILILDKPEGPTSHDVVAAVRRALGLRRVGHAGTLDPFATGVLVACIGSATRLSSVLAASEKDYEGVIRFGFATDTGDATGRAVGEARDVAVEVAALRGLVAERLSGWIEQVPPMYSAKKQGGVALHRLARRGIEVERAPSRVRASSWSLEPVNGAESSARVSFRVTCSAGTYVRVLASDLGELAGVGAHLETLRRTRSGSFHASSSVPLDTLNRESALAAMMPIDDVTLPLPDVILGGPGIDAFVHGRRVPHESAHAEGSAVAVRSEDGRLLGIGRVEAGRVVASAVLAPPE